MAADVVLTGNSKSQAGHLHLGAWNSSGLRFNHNGRALVHEFEQFDHILVTHPYAPVTRGLADFVLVPGTVNIDEAISRIGIVPVQPVEPQNARHHNILGRGKQFASLERDAAYKNGAARHSASNYLRHAKTP